MNNDGDGKWWWWLLGTFLTDEEKTESMLHNHEKLHSHQHPSKVTLLCFIGMVIYIKYERYIL